MPFSTTPILDNFNRANGGLGTDWTSPLVTGESTPTIDTNVVLAPASVFASAYRNLATYAETEVYFSIPAGSSAFSQARAVARLSSPGASGNYYYAQFDATGGIGLYRVIAGVSSGVLLSAANNTAAGHKVGLEVKTSGNDFLVEVFHDVGAGWVSRGVYTDAGRLTSTPALASGYIGFSQYGNAAITRSIDDFGGGTIVVGGGSSGGGKRMLTVGCG